MFSFFIWLLQVWENSKRTGKMIYSYLHLTAAHVHRRKKDNVLILALQVLFLSLGQLNFWWLCLFKETGWLKMHQEWHQESSDRRAAASDRWTKMAENAVFLHHFTKVPLTGTQNFLQRGLEASNRGAVTLSNPSLVPPLRCIVPCTCKTWDKWHLCKWTKNFRLLQLLLSFES